MAVSDPAGLDLNMQSHFKRAIGQAYEELCHSLAPVSVRGLWSPVVPDHIPEDYKTGVSRL